MSETKPEKPAEPNTDALPRKHPSSRFVSQPEKIEKKPDGTVLLP